MSASTSVRGGVRSQLHLRQILLSVNMFPINEPQLLVAEARNKFDENMRLTDEAAREILQDLLVTLVRWTKTLQRRD